MTDEVAACFKTILRNRKPTDLEKFIDGYTRFLFTDEKGMPLVAMHWEHRFNHMVARYNEIFREQMPNMCRHTYCSLQAKAGMYPKTLQYLMGEQLMTACDGDFISCELNRKEAVSTVWSCDY